MSSAVRHVSRQTVRWAVAFAAVLVVLVPVGSGVAVAANDRQVEDGTFTWGVRDSFRGYLTGPIADGKITVKDGATQRKGNGVFDFDVDRGTVRDGGARGAYFETKGTVRFYGHHGDLDVTIADPKINVNGNGDGTLTVMHTVPGQKATAVEMARVTDAQVKVSGNRATLRTAKMTLTKPGEKVFSWDGAAMYPEGTELDPGSSDVTLQKATPDPDPSDPGDPEPSDPGEPEPTTPAPKPSPTPSPKPSNPGKSPKPSTPSAGKSGQLTWGVKSSFRNYIAGPIAGGSVTTSGHASQSGSGAYVFPQRSTNAKPPSAKGTTGYRGQITFRGHQHGSSYDLDMSLRNPRVVMSSATRGKLVVDSKPTGAKSFSAVTVSTLDLSKGSRSTSSGSVTYSNVPVTLSSSGAKLFAWEGRSMYPAGTAMDPVSFTIGANTKVSGSGGSSTSAPKGGSPSSSSAGAGSGTSGAGGGGDTGTSGTGSAPSAGSVDSAGAGSLSWGLRKSFRDYITGPIANGSIAVSGGASASGEAYTFPQSGGAKGDGGADYRGTVNFRGHGGLLDLSFSDPAVSIDSASRGSLTAKVGGKRITVADLNLGASAKSESDGATVYADVPATLTSQGSTLFDYNGNSFYPAGTSLDPVTFTVGSASSAAAGGGTTGPETVASATDGISGADASALDPESAAASDAEVSEDACVATGRDLTWGFKESLRSYVSGSIAGGEWTTKGGATYSTPNFEWAKGKGTFDEKTRTGAVKFAGGIAFTGHDGKLNTTVSDPEIRLEGDRALLVLDAKGATMEAAMDGRDDTKAYSDVPFVEVDLSKAEVETKGGKTTITASKAPTTLTKEGEAAFSNYEEGTAFDPVSFTITARSSCLSPDKVKTKGATPDADAAAAAPSEGGGSGSGSDGIPMWAAWVGGGAAGAGLAAGATLLIARRKFAGAAS